MQQKCQKEEEIEILEKKKNFIILLPAVIQMVAFFSGDIFPFSGNEMYAGRPDRQSVRVIHWTAKQGAHLYPSRSDFSDEVYSFLIEEELERKHPDFVRICNWIAKDVTKGKFITSAAIARKSWNFLKKDNVRSPDAVEVLHECQFN